MLKPTNSDKVLVLGATSWLGYLLIQQQLSNQPNLQLAGSIYNNTIDFGFEIPLYSLQSLDDLKYMLQIFKPTVIVNFLRGENAQGMSYHEEIITFSKANQAHYVFASSALALDAYPTDTTLTENLQAKSISPYGIFKGECEQKLYDSSISWNIIRLASVQGWVPHKLTRNTNFLTKISKGEIITVDRGVIQNRMLADDVISGLRKLIQDRIQGIIHFGTTDSSDEYLYLRRQAKLFGYSPERVKSGKARDVNLNVVPNRIFSVLEDNYKYAEQTTLDKLLQFPALVAFRKPQIIQTNYENYN